MCKNKIVLKQDMETNMCIISRLNKLKQNANLKWFTLEEISHFFYFFKYWLYKRNCIKESFYNSNQREF